MVFSSLFFLFGFLPAVLFIYFVLPGRMRNLYLLIASLFFYAWGEGIFLLLMIFVVVVNFILGKSFGYTEGKRRTFLLAVGLVLNLAPLVFYKYSSFLLEQLNLVLQAAHVPILFDGFSVHLPLGISFFTFQALSYLVDTYKGRTEPQDSLINLGLYISLFPQLIAGPIVRYKDISRQLKERVVSLDGFSLGIERFIIGLGKKVLLANPLGEMADMVFSLPADQITTGTMWIGAASYMFQIYFDFSGYSDMAIGLGRMFGFHFLENFNFPYISKSVQEFWRRWHISLSNWFRDYLYIPLGGNRKGSRRTMQNLLTVFLLCGFWHGAEWTFVFWGFYHGLFLVLERGRFGRVLERLPAVARHGYLLLVVLIGWVFFRAETLGDGFRFVSIMFGLDHADTIPYQVITRLDPTFYISFFSAALFSFPVLKTFQEPRENGAMGSDTISLQAGGAVKLLALSVVLLFSITSLATGAYNPFIYFRF